MADSAFVQKGKDLTYLTFVKLLRIQQASANLHQIAEKLFLWC